MVSGILAISMLLLLLLLVDIYYIAAVNRSIDRVHPVSMIRIRFIRSSSGSTCMYGTAGPARDPAGRWSHCIPWPRR
jgi:hypothetical protein